MKVQMTFEWPKIGPKLGQNGSFLGDFGPFWGCFGVTLGSIWHRFGIVSGSFCRHFKVFLGILGLFLAFSVFLRSFFLDFWWHIENSNAKMSKMRQYNAKKYAIFRQN